MNHALLGVEDGPRASLAGVQRRPLVATGLGCFNAGQQQ
jgi:hypothetical protein